MILEGTTGAHSFQRMLDTGVLWEYALTVSGVPPVGARKVHVGDVQAQNLAVGDALVAKMCVGDAVVWER